jgi:uncharacterized 2Fe-2S/4Fe-4S cluster protein (DUF4445 family)
MTHSWAERFTLIFEPLGRAVDCSQDETLLDAARRAGERLVASCGGRGTCKACQVRIKEGAIEGDEADEQGWVRACRARPLSDLRVEPSPRSLALPERTDVQGVEAATPLEPSLRAIPFALAPPSLQDAKPDDERLQEALAAAGAGRVVIDLAMLCDLPRSLSRLNWRGRAVLCGHHLAALQPDGAPLLGLAVDLGTTNAAGYLYNLESGKRLAGGGIENLQAVFGADVVTRITHAVRSPKGGFELAHAARQSVLLLARALCETANQRMEDIAEIALCGNTAMHHLLLGLPVEALGAAPFVAASQGALDLAARELDLAFAPGARLHLMPGVGGYVGGDHTAALLAARHLHEGGASLILDIGTNTEISLLKGDEIHSISCPSGPALEGGHIACGMRAAQGAVERVREDGQGGYILKTIEDAEPVGLCGSGVLDAVAAFLRTGLIDRSGRIQAGHPMTVERKEGRAIRLASPDLLLTQADIRAVQLAKAAIRAGIDLLLAETGLAEGGLQRVIVAGAFGAYIDLASAQQIGLLPTLPLERFAQVGNAAGVGVGMALKSTRCREEAVLLARQCRYLELSGRPEFQKTFIARMKL